MTTALFDLYDREKQLLAEGVELLAATDEARLREYALRLYERFSGVVRENEDLTRHSDRQEQRLVKLNQNLKAQTRELDEQRHLFEELSRQLAKYLPPQIHEGLFAGRYDTKVSTQRKKLTVFFSDIKEFTTTAESLQPEALTEYLNEYFSEMTQIALDHGATIDKYIGDAMMVFFGDPETRGVREDARACVEMALKMQDQMKVLGRRWIARGFDRPFVIRIGINTGYCNVGNFGSEQRLSYTIIGGEVNIAQRLESQSEPGGILLSHETFAHVHDMVTVEDRPAIRLKGIAREVRAYAVKGRRSAMSEALVLHDPAGIAIDMQTGLMGFDERSRLAGELRAIANRLEVADPNGKRDVP